MFRLFCFLVTMRICFSHIWNELRSLPIFQVSSVLAELWINTYLLNKIMVREN